MYIKEFIKSLGMMLGDGVAAPLPADLQLIKEAWTKEVKAYYRALPAPRKLIKIGDHGRLVLAVPRDAARAIMVTAVRAVQAAVQAEQEARLAALDGFLAPPEQPEAPAESSSEDEDAP